MIARLLGGAATLALSAGAASADYTLHILHVNDLHSRIEAINGSDSTCSAQEAEEAKCFGGVARLYTKVNELRDAIRAEGGNVIVLDAGDQFQGSLMYTTYKGTAEAEFMNAIGFDAMAVGNHEFDDGPEKLAEFVDLIEFPIISGNLDLSQSNILKEKVQNHIVLEVGGERIGIISALATDTVETSSPGPNVIFQDEIDSLAADVADPDGRGRHEDHRADPRGAAQGHRHRRRRPRHRRGGGRAFAHLPLRLGPRACGRLSHVGEPGGRHARPRRAGLCLLEVPGPPAAHLR
jgi:5'-nucleotidase / UDP-sugar diphosphatase